MTTSLVIGDPHFKVSNLSDCESFADQLIALIETEKPEQIILLGDLFNDFAVVRSEVLKLWTVFFQRASKLTKVICLVGNHDMAGADGGTFPMEPFKTIPNVTIVDKLMQIDGINYMPFVRNNSEFETTVRGIAPDSVLFCHQSFNGATFENGFFDPHGADPVCVQHLGAVICGHIHKEQLMANIYYPGAPFQHSFGDSGQLKSVVMMDLHKNCYTITKKHKLSMPEYAVITFPEVHQLIPYLYSLLKFNDHDLSKLNIKIISHGSPAEIAAFWQDELVKELRSKARRVVDAMTSMKPLNERTEIKGITRKEQFDEYIKAKEWRTDADRVARRAREFFSL